MDAGAPVREGRRALLRGHPGRAATMRPPWALDEAAFVDACTRCDACVEACPEGVLSRGDGGFPEVRFRGAECTFCRACVDACAPSALSPAVRPPWRWRARIEVSCLAVGGVHCQSCRDACPESAIRFPLRPGVPQPVIDSSRCTGCGACVGACPVAAVGMVQAGVEGAA